MTAPKRINISGRFFALLNDHKIEEALACTTDHFKVTFGESGFSVLKDDFRRAVGWDVGANGRVSCRKSEIVGDDVVVQCWETNDFLSLLGIEGLTFQATLRFDSDDLIDEYVFELLPDQPSHEEAMKPAIDWASQHEPQELAQIYPDGQLVYSEEMATRWVALLERWRRATGGEQ